MQSGRIILGAVLAGLVGFGGWLYIAEPEAQGGRRGGRVVSVVADPVATRSFSDIVEAIGTANARESVMLTSRVSDTVKTVHFEDGQVVQKGDLLVTLEDREEKANVREAKANLEEAESQYARIEDLVTRGNASTSNRDAQKRRVDEAHFRLDAAKARLADRRIVAPFDGVLGLRQISEGSLLSANTVITSIDAIDTVYVDFSVPERFIATLDEGQIVDAKVSAYPDRTFSGTVKTVSSRVDPVTRSVLVRAEVENADHALRPGLLMRVQVVSRTWDAFSVAEQAVVPTGGKNYVFILNGDEAERREVTLGIRRPGYVEVLSGLDGSEKVVTEGTMRLGRQGTKVKELVREGAE
ncbi:efflux RND transporter periplasmic adaptor subunit [Kordiimonas laminariae]|uniref:efflux RND transporter periplasmic adaptor subunit n=1 Tax=Kordiimonas laminariae TaxID=2917717 RepID=UPI001FF1B13E|nr:efflux RND transporter periplasmic adaptor subunit [Kordiimonas laminariae]